MSRRRVEPPVELDPLEVDEDDEDDDEDDEDEDDVEYFVEDELPESVRTSVPKSVQSSQSCSSAPSTFVVVSDGLSAPHISHWGIPTRSGPREIKGATARRSYGSLSQFPSDSPARPGEPQGMRYDEPYQDRSRHAPQNRWSAVR
jgi:hypothetical protein